MTAEESQIAAVETGQQPKTVILRLKDPVRVVERYGRVRVLAAFFAEVERSSLERVAEGARPFLRSVFAGALLLGWPRSDPLLLPPAVILFTVAEARRSASSSGTPRCS